MIKTKELNEHQRLSIERLAMLIDEHCGGKQSEFVRQTGINKALVSQYLKGNNTMGIETAITIGKVYAIDPLWVLGYNTDDFEHYTILGKINQLNKEGIKKLISYLDKLIDDKKYRI